MKLLLVNLGNQSECLASTSVLRKLSNHKLDIYALTRDEGTSCVFEHHRLVEKVFTLRDMNEVYKCDFDILINLHPAFKDDGVSALEKIGFNYGNDDYYEVMFGNKKSDMSLFQIYYRLCGLIWKGDSYDFSYYPKNKSKDNRTGIAVANVNLRNYVLTELDLRESRIWHIPFKNNLLRKMDEINRCKMVITDDFLTMTCATILRKKIHFLNTLNYNFKIEMFGSGEIYNVPKNILIT